MKTAIVLSGGGAKGAYQIGVWKALRKLKIKYDVVTGTSVGALNGVMMVQNDYHTAKRVWSNIDYETVFNNEFKNIDESPHVTYIKQFVMAGGIDIANLKSLLDRVYNKKKFYSSKVDFGLVVYNLSNKKEELLDKKSINPNHLKDFVIASASCYPAFKTKIIDGDKYIDGGYYDNLPINLAIDLGADRIIAVDLKAPGIRQKQKNMNVDLIKICPNNDIGWFLEFDKNLARRSINYGYNDTMKIFNRLKGNKYTFHKKFYELVFNSMFNKCQRKIKEILKSDKLSEKEFQDIIEYAGEVFNIDDTKVYYIDYYNYQLKKRFKRIPEVDKKTISAKILKKDVKGLLESKYIVKYIYQKLVHNNKPKELDFLAMVFRKDFLTAIYLIMLKG